MGFTVYSKKLEMSEDSAYVSIHPSNVVPYNSGMSRDLAFVKLTENVTKTIWFWKKSARLLEAPYDTNCSDYQSSKMENFGCSQSDCHWRCRHQNIWSRCGCLSIDNLQFRVDLFDNNTIICPWMSLAKIKCLKRFDEAEEICLMRCPIGCRQDFYSWDVEETKPFRAFGNSIVNFRHAAKPDTSISYSAALTWLQLICNLGSLAGFWLGFSIFTFLLSTRRKITKV